MSGHHLRHRIHQFISILSGAALIILIASGPPAAQRAPAGATTTGARK